MASGTEIIDILVRMRGGQAAAREASTVERSITRIATAAVLVGGAFGAWRGIMAGVNFNATMETNQIAFEKFTGSVEAGSKELAELRKLANDIPAFGFDVYATNAKKLLALGRPLSKVNDDLRTMAETALGLGLGSEGIDRMTLALGQMQSTGVVQGDELRQLQEAGIKVFEYMEKAGLITKGDIGQIGDMHIEASKAIDAIMTGMQKDFGGLASKASGTWAFQMGALRNQATQAAGALVKPIMAFLQAKVLPKLTAEFKKIAGWLNDGGAERLYETLGKILKVMAPLIAAMVVYRTALLLVTGAQILAALGATVVMMWGIAAAAWAAGGPIMVIAVAVAAMGGLAVVAVAAVLALVAAVVVLYFKWGWFHRAVDNTWDAIVTAAKWAGNAMVDAFQWTVTAIKDLINVLLKAWNSLNFTIPAVDAGPLGKIGGISIGVGHIPLLADGGNVAMGGRAIVGDAGPELLENQGGVAKVTPLGPGGATRMLQPVVWQVDGRTIAEIVVDVGQTSAARA